MLGDEGVRQSVGCPIAVSLFGYEQMLDAHILSLEVQTQKSEKVEKRTFMKWISNITNSPVHQGHGFYF